MPLATSIQTDQPPQVPLGAVPSEQAPEVTPVETPTSILGDEVAPGAPIPPEKMHEAGKADFHAEMRDFGDREAANRGNMLALDPNDPDYLKKLAAHQAQAGLIKSEKAHFAQMHPYGSAVSAHPGFGGKILHELGNIGNVVGNATLGKENMSAIPGSHANLESEVTAGEGQIANASKQGLEAAQAENATATASQAPSKIDKNTAQAGAAEAGAGKTNVQTDLLKNPNPETKFEQLQDGSVVGLTTDPHTGNTSAKLLYKGDPKRQTQIATLKAADGTMHSVLTDKNTGEQIKDLGETRAPGTGGASSNLVVLPGGKVEQLRPGMTLPEGTQNIAGFSTMNRPTNATRTMGEMAGTVLAQTPKLKDEVDKLSEKVGPGEGRWNDFWVNKAGIDDPEFAALDTDLDLYASALVRTHFGARGGQEYRKELHKRFSEAQSPEDLKARIDGATSWIEGYAKAGEGKGGGEKLTAKPTTAHKVGDTIIQKGHQYKVTAVDKDGRVTSAE